MVQVVADVELTAHYSCQPMGRGLCSKSRAAGAPRASRGLTGPPHEVAQGRVRLLSRKSVGFGHFSEAACGVAALPETARVKGGFVELFGGVGTMARAAVRVGLSCTAVVEKHAPSRKLNVERLREAAQDPVVCADIFEED